MKWKEIKLILFFFVVKIKNFDASNFTTLKLRELLHLVCFTVDFCFHLLLEVINVITLHRQVFMNISQCWCDVIPFSCHLKHLDILQQLMILRN